MNQFDTQVDDSIIEAVIRDGTADMVKSILKVISAAAFTYADKIMRKLENMAIMRN